MLIVFATFFRAMCDGQDFIMWGRWTIPCWSDGLNAVDDGRLFNDSCQASCVFHITKEEYG